uniref:Uncharacterized protein n=1 Tax=Amphimedon queenslandica TaxID=400682 RepID=A0A1X7U637_AMPQE
MTPNVRQYKQQLQLLRDRQQNKYRFY